MSEEHLDILDTLDVLLAQAVQRMIEQTRARKMLRPCNTGMSQNLLEMIGKRIQSQGIFCDNELDYAKEIVAWLTRHIDFSR